MLQDFHLHTLVSDGDLEPTDVLRRAAGRDVRRLSLTDHDALGAYRWRDGAVFDEARRLGMDLTVGIELDADWEGREVHLLGFAISLEAEALGEHLGSVQQARRERARLEIDVVNGALGPGTIKEEDVFAPGRETLMKPHFIHPMLEKGLFATYEEANAWYRRNVKTGVSVPKPALADAIALVHDAGGWASLAHPGYYQADGRDVVASFEEMSALGLDAVEADYPYHACSPHLFSAEDERSFVGRVKQAAEGAGLRTTRGSDCHTAADFDKVYG